MDFYDILFAKKLGGGGGSSVDVESLSVTANGTYTAEEGKAYSPVTVNVAGWTTDGIADRSQPNGAITISASVETIGEKAFFNCKGITSVDINGDAFIGSYAFGGCSGITKVFGAGVTKAKATKYNAWGYTFSDCNHMITAVFPKMGDDADLQQYVFQSCSLLESADFNSCNKIGNNTFKNCNSLRTLVIRRTDAVATATNMGSYGFGGIYNNPNESAIYVPSALVSSYQAASNWSALYALNNNIFKAIEGSIYENAYVDGTPIS